MQKLGHVVQAGYVTFLQAGEWTSYHQFRTEHRCRRNLVDSSFEASRFADIKQITILYGIGLFTFQRYFFLALP